MARARAFSSLGCPAASLDEALDLARAHGLAAVELRTLGGTADLAAYFSSHYGTPAALAAHVRAQPVRVAALNAGFALAAPTDTARAELAALAPWADALGAPWLRVFDGGKHADAAELAVAAAELSRWRALRAAHGWTVDLMVETHDSLLGAAAASRFLAACPGTALLWDAHHTWRKGSEDPVATWRALRPHVAHIHLKDSIPVPSARHPFTYVLPGDGDFPVAPLLAALEADAYAGLVSLEWEKHWHPYLPSLDEALRTAATRRWW